MVRGDALKLGAYFDE